MEMNKVCWDFPLLGTASLQGNNDGNIQMFKGTGIMDGLAREVCQNSLDARDSDVPSDLPVQVNFKLFYINKSDFSVFSELKSVIDESRSYWNSNTEVTDDIIGFLDNVDKYLEMDRIPVLMMSDYNTIGLNGIDPKPGEISYWNLLVNTEGISKKEDKNSAGSFGIGKRAPFAYSGLSTVFYNTLAKDGGKGFEGVSHLVTSQKDYQDTKLPTQSSGKYLFLLNEYQGRPILPEDECELAKLPEFKRTKNGTDVAIFGFKLDEYDNWENAIGIAVLKNFILAIKDHKLEVNIESPEKRIHISDKCLEDLLYKQYKSEIQLKTTRQIFETVTKTEPRYANIAETNDLSIYVKYDDAYSATFSRFRSTGMLINTTSESLPHYSVVVIANDVGETILSSTLRKSEPPQHTEWKAKNITDNRALHNLAAKFIRNIFKEVQKVLDEFERVEISEKMDAGIGNYLPNSAEGASTEGTDGLRTDIRITEIKTNQGKKLYSNQYESAATAVGDETQRTGVKAGKKKKRKKGKEKIVVVEPSQDPNSNKSGVAPGEGLVKIASLEGIENRIFHLSQNAYRMFIDSPSEYSNVFIQFYAGRDDNDQDSIDIEWVKEENKPRYEVHHSKVGPIELKKGPNTIHVGFENRELMALVPIFTREIKANEKE